LTLINFRSTASPRIVASRLRASRAVRDAYRPRVAQQLRAPHLPTRRGYLTDNLHHSLYKDQCRLLGSASIREINVMTLRRVFTAGLSALTVAGTILAAGSAASAAVPAPLFRAKLMADHSGKCLDVAAASKADAAFVQQWHCYDAPNNQTWNFIAVVGGPIADGYLADNYYTIRADHSAKCLQVAGASIADQATVDQMTCDPNNRQTNQQWRLVQQSDGHFNLVARHSGKCLEVKGGSLSDGIGVVQQTCSPDRPYQEWKLH
jgi:hypothetical protein